MYKKIILVSVLVIFYLASMIFVFFHAGKRTTNYYQPVRMSASDERAPVGFVIPDLDDKTKIKSSSYMHISNYSAQEQKVTFVVYQHSIRGDYDCFFDIDCIYITKERSDPKEVIEDGIVKIQAGETLYIRIAATARDSSKAITSRGGPWVEIVVLDD